MKSAPSGRSLRVGLLTGGGDCPGLNAAIRSVVKMALREADCEVFGFRDGFEGFIRNDVKKLNLDDVSGILHRGGTVLGASNRANPFKYEQKLNGKKVIQDVSKKCCDNFSSLRLDGLICIGGDGTLKTARELSKKGLPILGIPKTIDNDVFGTERTIGFDTAVSVSTEAIDRVRTTAQSHHRAMVVEVMGRYTGWLALCGGLAGGADVILLPEFPYDLQAVCRAVVDRKASGKHFSLIVVSEGARPQGRGYQVARWVDDPSDPVRLGGIGLQLAREIELETGIESRATILGYLPRGASPTPYDRILATEFGERAVEMVAKGEYGVYLVFRSGRIQPVPLNEVASSPRSVPPNAPLIKTAQKLNTSFGQIGNRLIQHLEPVPRSA